MPTGTHYLDQDDSLAKRRNLTVCQKDPIVLNSVRRQYIRTFILSQGFNPQNLDDDKMIKLFFVLARIEEYATQHKHNHHNWEMYFAPIERQGERLEPVVDLMLRQWAEENILRALPASPPLWPDGKKFALCLTHDVDRISDNLLKERLRSLSTYRDAPDHEKIIVALSTMKEITRSAFFWKPRLDPPLDMWLEQEARHRFRSSFFFLAHPLPKPSWEDGFYSYDDCITFEGKKRKVAEVMSAITQKGWDIGLHGASHSSCSPDLLRREKEIAEKAIGSSIHTIRQHHLLFDIRYTPYFQACAGFKVDSTMGSNIDIAFRCGTSFPFFLYDLYADQPLDLLEVPLIIQDVAIFRVMGLTEGLALEQCVEVMHKVAQLNGVLTLLWHNHYHRDSLEFSVYCKLLQGAQKMGAWGCSLRQINDWWRKRIRMLTQDLNNK